MIERSKSKDQVMPFFSPLFDYGEKGGDQELRNEDGERKKDSTIVVVTLFESL